MLGYKSPQMEIYLVFTGNHSPNNGQLSPPIQFTKGRVESYLYFSTAGSSEFWEN